jgi:hypothetical protein
MDTEEDPDWLGEDMIQRNGSRITVPEAVVDAGIVTPEAPVFWALDDEGLVLSNDRAPFADAGRARLLGEATLGPDREVTLPSEIADREGFDAGDILHFVTAPAFDPDRVCRILSEDRSEQLRSEMSEWRR